MTIDYELELILLAADEISESPGFRLGESFIAWPKISTQFSLIFDVLSFPVNSEISIEINTRVLLTALGEVWIHILSLVDNFVF